MRIIVLSDTHGNPKVLETILTRHADADACIHLGDGEGDVKLFLSCHPEWESKFYAVRGNCDFNSSLPISRTIEHRPARTHPRSPQRIPQRRLSDESRQCRSATGWHAAVLCLHRL